MEIFLLVLLGLITVFSGVVVALNIVATRRGDTEKSRVLNLAWAISQIAWSLVFLLILLLTDLIV